VISDTVKGEVELSAVLVAEELLSFLEHPLPISRDAVSRMKAAWQRFSFIFMSYSIYYFL
jgi:hypothetical protein